MAKVTMRKESDEEYLKKINIVPIFKVVTKV
jgi:hypothetical protein